MTALSEYERLEATGLWRASAEEQRREVIVSIGDATLTIADKNDTALAHWSIPAIARANQEQMPAIFFPDGSPDETLELRDDADDMIAAIEKLRAAVERRRPHPGRLRTVTLITSLTVVALLAVFWLPQALVSHTVSVVPPVKRAAIGQALLTRLERVSGRPCSDSLGSRPLARLSARIPSPQGPARLVVLRSGVKETLQLPGNIILINNTLIEDHEEPDVVAGYLIAQHLNTQLQDPLRHLLNSAGLIATFRLLTTGSLTDSILQAYSERLVQSALAPPADDILLRGFNAWGVRSTPYARARDVSGESTLALIEADPFIGKTTEPILSDGNWIRLQDICGG